MNRKTVLSIVLVVVLVMIVFISVYLVFQNKDLKKQQKDLSLISNEEIVEILKTDKDIEAYTQKYSDFKIISKEILTKDSILAGQNGQNLQPLYYGLELENDRYMKVQLMDRLGSNGFFGVIDSKDNSVTKAFGILLFQASAEAIQNGQKTSPTENK